MDIPGRAYKYLPFGVRALDWLTTESVYFADPRRFNDPLDCAPSVSVDIPADRLEPLFRGFAQALGRQEPQIEHVLREHRNWCSQFRRDEAGEEFVECLRREIQQMLRDHLGRSGVLSLSQLWDSTLMWSHYADQHRGVCIEYDLSDRDDLGFDIGCVDYERPPHIRASDIRKGWILDDECARRRCEDSYFFTKASEWCYEEEVRVVSRGRIGVDSAPFHMTAVHFGMRCEPSVRISIVKLLYDRRLGLSFYNVHRQPGTFQLRRVEVDVEELLATSVTSSARMHFKHIAPGTLERLEE